MKSQLAACICIALTQLCWADETITCKGDTGRTYTAEGGIAKRGWSVVETKNVTKLVQTKSVEKGSVWDIQVTTERGKISALDAGCRVNHMQELGAVLGLDMMPDPYNLDQAFLVACKEMISTYLFYTRSGVNQLLETHLVIPHGATTATVSFTKDCKPGD